MCSARPRCAPSDCATVWVTSVWSRSADRPTQKTPALNAGTSSEATSSASRVLPEPPGPERVTRREPFRSRPRARPARAPCRRRRTRDAAGSCSRSSSAAESARSRAGRADRLVEVLQAVLTQLGQVAVDERPRRRRQDDLTTVARRGDPRGPVQLPPRVALAGQCNSPVCKPIRTLTSPDASAS